MVEDGFDPDSLTFGYILEGLGRAGPITETIGTFAKLKEKRRCVLNVDLFNLFNAMIFNFISIVDIDECFKYYNSILGNNCEPTMDAYVLTISNLFKARRAPDALKVSDDRIGQGMMPATGTVTSFIKFLCSYGPPHAAMMIYKKARDTGCVVSLLGESSSTLEFFRHLSGVSRHFTISSAIKNEDGGSDLPLDILNLIVVMIATDGARDLARASATSKVLLTLAREPHVLRMVNFQRLTFTTGSFRMHHHRKDLLCMCARAGNQAARSILGKALLFHDSWFLGMICDGNQRAYYRRIPASAALHHHNLVRTFILNATSKDIVVMRQNMVNYVITYAGYSAAREYGLVDAICNMCNNEAARHRVTRVGSNQVSCSSIVDVLALLEPAHETLSRDTVIILFDKLFPSARD